MALLKQPPTQATAFSFADVEREAAGTLDRARGEADALLAAARHEADELRRRSSERGYAEGHAKGVEAGRADGEAAGQAEAFLKHEAELTQLVTTLGGLIDEFEEHRHALKDNVAADVTRLALAVAEKVTKRHGQIDPQVLVKNIAATARLVADGHDLRVMVNPEQESLLTDLLPRLAADWPTLASAQVVADGTIDPGGCRLTNAAGSIDADLATQLDHLAAELLPEPQHG